MGSQIFSTPFFLLADSRLPVEGSYPGSDSMSDTITPSIKRLLPWLVAVAFFMESLDTTILNTAVPVMAHALGVLPLSMKAVLSSYTLSLAVFIPISSWVADRFGTRRVFASAIGIFTLGSLLCGLSNGLHVLVACRILQGCGGAMMVPVGRLTLVKAFARSELVAAISFVGIPALIGPMLGPLAGGLIVDYLHWRMIFLVNLPIGLIGLYLVHRFLPDFHGDHEDPLDLVGLILFGSGIALLSYVLEVFGEHTLTLTEIAGLLAIAFALLGAYWLHARGTSYPLLRLDLFHIRTFRVAVVGNFITRIAAGGMPFLLPLLYQLGLGYSPVESGLLTLPQSITAMALKMAMPKILSRFGYRHVLLTNTIAMGALIAVFALVTRATPVWVLIVVASFYGFFSSLQFTSMNTLVYADVIEDQLSMASTIVSTVQQMALSFGVATASLCAALFIPDRMHSTIAQLIRGIHISFCLLGGLTVLSAFPFAELTGSDGDNVSRHHAGLAH
jgi:EmrB/QacA subfamily drug resistance transporter